MRATAGLRAALIAAALLLPALRAGAAPSFDKEAAVVFSSAAPQAFAGTYPSLRLYFIRLSSGTEVGSALSADGISWAEDAPGGRLSTATLPSVSASSITGCAVLPIAGGFRMLYSIVSTTGAYRIHSATSADGLAWANDAGVRIDNGASFLTSPKLVPLTDGSWRLYYVGAPGRRVFTSRSTDSGLTWSAPAVAMSTPAFEVGAGVLTNGLVRLYYTESLPGVSSGAVILSALSTDASGTSFDLDAGVRVSTAIASGSVGFPVPVRSTSTDSFRWRLYYDFADPGVISTANIHSALTGAPAPSALAPSAVVNDSTRTIVIAGDVFSPAPSVRLSLGASTLLPSSLVRTDDQTLRATFDFNNAPAGRWDVAVTNADARTATLSQALFVDFPGGSTRLVNNLLRPRTGTSTAIDITTFNDGVITARLYSLDGRKIRTLFDGFRTKGVLALSWDGRDSGGAPVASGVYVLRVLGPKVDAKDKIVVIR
jgi:hypothetical protein